MITLKHIDIYKKYNGDGDHFTHCANSEEKFILNYDKWSLIEDLLQDLIIVKKGFASVSFFKSVDEKLKNNCDSEETIKALRNIV